MKTMSFYITPLFVLLCIPSCSGQKIKPGVYVKAPEERTLKSEKEEIILYPDQDRTFEYIYFDEPDQTTYGSGTYRQTDKKLILRFDERLHPASEKGNLSIIHKGTVMKFEIIDVSKDHIELKLDDREKYFALKEPD